MNRTAKFSQADITRILRGAKAAGQPVRVEIHPDGKILAIPYDSRAGMEAKHNEWDNLE